MTDIVVVVGAQFGSEGKGAISAHLSRNFGQHDAVMRVAGPNAGHTAYDGTGREWKLRTVPVGAVSSPTCQLLLAAGSEIDLGVLESEVTALDAAGFRVSERLKIHPSATMIDPRHVAAEHEAGLVGRVGSTGKGIGAARSARIMRTAVTYGQFVEHGAKNPLWGKLLGHRASIQSEFDHLLIEGTQGYGLGLRTEFYPQTTSSDCRAIDFLSMAGISPWADDTQVRVVVVARVYPIRVAGNSGPLKGETSWEVLGLPQERTTVTNKVRRVGEWDEALVREAIHANGGGHFHPDVVLALTMLDQRFPSEAGETTKLGGDADAYVRNLEAGLECEIAYVGTGPTTVVDR